MDRDDSFLREWLKTAGADPRDDAAPDTGGLRFRTVWISDIHLGTPGCQAHALLEFLRRVECDTLFLVGDIVDGWQLRRSWYWPQAHNDVVQKVLRKARKGTRVIFVPGNHDEFARRYIGHEFGGIEVAEEWIHVTADGKRLWVTHGDLFDGVIQCAKWLAYVGDWFYELTLRLNRHFNSMRARIGLPYWSLSKYLKQKVKRAVSYVGDFESALAREARKRGADGVVCGHIHHAELRTIDGIVYANDGDWVESLTALVEHADGRLEIFDGSARSATAVRPRVRARSTAAGRGGMRIVVVTDAWTPQVNGVVTTLVDLRARLVAAGHEVEVVEPSTFCTVACPGYGEIRLAWRARDEVGRRLAASGADAIHVATEGPLGLAARAWCRRRGVPFTTAFHSRFPDFLAAAFGIPARWGYAAMRRFHAPSAGVMVPSAGTFDILRRHGFRNLRRWSHGIDLSLFRPNPDASLPWPRPLFLFVGRVSPEKNLDAFLDLDLPGSKVVCGGGPLLERYRRAHPDVHWIGSVPRHRLVDFYAAADAFVYPSRTDTFGLVMLEALACGTPVAAYPVDGPLDVVGDSDGGVLDVDLGRAALAALHVPRERARARALEFDWDRVSREFVSHLAPIERHAVATEIAAVEGLA